MEENNFIDSKYHNGVKITNAVYKILETLPENDPLKNKAKEKALAILENVTLVFGTEGWFSLSRSAEGDTGSSMGSGQKEKASTQVLYDIEVLESYLEIGKSLGWIDTMNFLIITKEYKLIEASLRKQILNPKLETLNKLKIEKQAIKKDLPKPDQVSHKALARQQKILKILTEKEKAQVADFIKELPNITKRTVRRDLDDLLKKGKIVRAGEWNQVFYQKMS